MVKRAEVLGPFALALIAFSIAHSSMAQTRSEKPYTAILTCIVTEPWSRAAATPIVEKRVLVVPASELNKDLRVLSLPNKPEKFLGRVGLSMVETHTKGLVEPTRFDFVQTQAGSLSGMSIEGIAYLGVVPTYALSVDVWESGKPIRLYTFKSGVVGAGTCQ